MKLFNLMPAALVLEALLFLYIGVRGLVLKRPFVLATRWIFLVLMIPISGSLWMMLQVQGEMQRLPTSSPDGFLRVVPVMVLVSVLMLWLAMRGYTIYGVTEDSFRTALRAALDRLGLRYEESVAGIRLVDLDTDLSATVQGRMGTAQIQIKQRQRQEVLKPIAAGMQEYFNSSPTPVNLVPCAFHAALGALMFVMAFGFWQLTNWTDGMRANLHRPIYQAADSWRNPGPAPSSVESPGPFPDLRGTWVGPYDPTEPPAVLTVTRQTGSFFHAVLTEDKGPELIQVAMTGTLFPDGRLQMEETSVIREPVLHLWKLGMDAGVLSEDGQEISGVGIDLAHDTYRWSMRRQSASVSAPNR